MSVGTLHAAASVRRTRVSHCFAPLPPRVLVGIGKSERRDVLVKTLRRVRMEVAVASNGCQVLARASVACSERAWRRLCRTDFDLVVVDADEVTNPSGFVTALRQYDYPGPILALAAEPHRRTEFLRAGFDDYLPYSTTNVNELLQGIETMPWSQKTTQPPLPLAATR